MFCLFFFSWKCFIKIQLCLMWFSVCLLWRNASTSIETSFPAMNSTLVCVWMLSECTQVNVRFFAGCVPSHHDGMSDLRLVQFYNIFHSIHLCSVSDSFPTILRLVKNENASNMKYLSVWWVRVGRAEHLFRPNWKQHGNHLNDYEY